MNTYKCQNCNGTGKLSQFQHVHQGICFVCNGTGKIQSTDKINGPKLAWVEYHVGAGEYAKYLEWCLEATGHIFTVDAINDYTGLKHELRSERANTLAQAATWLKESNGTYEAQWFALVKFASVCFLLGQVGIERGRAAVKRERGEEWLPKYEKAILELQQRHGEA